MQRLSNDAGAFFLGCFVYFLPTERAECGVGHPFLLDHPPFILGVGYKRHVHAIYLFYSPKRALTATIIMGANLRGYLLYQFHNRDNGSFQSKYPPPPVLLTRGKCITPGDRFIRRHHDSILPKPAQNIGERV